MRRSHSQKAQRRSGVRRRRCRIRHRRTSHQQSAVAASWSTATSSATQLHLRPRGAAQTVLTSASLRRARREDVVSSTLQWSSMSRAPGLQRTQHRAQFDRASRGHDRSGKRRHWAGPRLGSACRSFARWLLRAATHDRVMNLTPISRSLRPLHKPLTSPMRRNRLCGVRAITRTDLSRRPGFRNRI